MKWHFIHSGDQIIADVAIILQIMFITLGMVVFGLVLNKLLGINPEVVKKIQEEAKNLQDRMRAAQSLGDFQMMQRMQQESLQLSKQMMTKQFLPQCFRLILFLIIFALIGVVYSNYSSGLLPFKIFNNDGWFSLYIVFSVIFASFFWVLKKVYNYKKENDDEWKLNRMGLIKLYTNRIDIDESPLQVHLN